MRRSSFVMERKNKTTTNLNRTKQQSELKDSKDNYIYNYRKINNLNSDVNKILRNINLLFDFKKFEKNKLQPLEKVSLIF